MILPYCIMVQEYTFSFNTKMYAKIVFHKLFKYDINSYYNVIHIWVIDIKNIEKYHSIQIEFINELVISIKYEYRNTIINYECIFICQINKYP